MIRSAVRFLPVLASVMLLTSAGGTKAAPVRGTGWEESGQATWYGGRHHGRRTSSGDMFDQNKMTAAHPSLPLGSRVRVTMQETGASVVVLVNDRQPPSSVRVIDLSRGAAARIGLLGMGRGMVTLSPAGAAEEIEVAEAPAEAGDPDVSDAYPRRRGLRHTRRGARAATADRPCCRATSVVRVRHSAQRPATPRRL